MDTEEIRKRLVACAEAMKAKGATNEIYVQFAISADRAHDEMWLHAKGLPQGDGQDFHRFIYGEVGFVLAKAEATIAELRNARSDAAAWAAEFAQPMVTRPEREERAA